MTRWPPATSVSLLAVATTLPAASAASTGRRLTIPPVATTTRSTSSRVANCSRASGARSSFVPRGTSRCAPPSSRRPGPRRVAAPRQLRRERRRVTPRGQRHDLELASGRRLSTSSAWRPIDPVEPSSATRIGARLLSHVGELVPSTGTRQARRRAPARRTGTSRRGRGCRRGPGSGRRSPWRRPRA